MLGRLQARLVRVLLIDYPHSDPLANHLHANENGDAANKSSKYQTDKPCLAAWTAPFVHSNQRDKINRRLFQASLVGCLVDSSVPKMRSGRVTGQLTDIRQILMQYTTKDTINGAK